MLSETLRLAEFLTSRFDDQAKRNRVKRQILESIHGELSFNNELLQEADKMRSKAPELVVPLVNQTKTHAFDSVVTAGLPLTEIFGQYWGGPTQGVYGGTQYMGSLTTVQELIERAYHRLAIQKVRDSVGIEKNGTSFKYLCALHLEAKLATKIKPEAI